MSIQSSMQPYEIITAPFEVWFAEEGVAFPAVDADMSTEMDWSLLGTNGVRNYGNDGVTVTHEQEVERHRTAGTTGPVKASRTEENLLINFVLHDLKLEEYTRVLNNQTVEETTPATDQAGTSQIGLSMGLSISTFALLVRGPSPYGADFIMQYEIPRAYQEGSPEIVYNKGVMAGLNYNFVVLEDLTIDAEDRRFGTLRAQTAVASSA